MTQVVIVAHTPLASALKAVAEHVYPDCGSALAALDVDAGADPHATEGRLRELLSSLAQREVLMLTDVFAATPSNVAARVAADSASTRLVAGVNVPMLWRVLCYRHEPLDVVVTKAVEAARGIMHVAAAPPQNQNPAATPARDAHLDDRHQQ